VQGKLKNDEDFGIDGRIRVILLKRNSNDFTISVCWTLCKIRRVYTVSSTHGSEPCLDVTIRFASGGVLQLKAHCTFGGLRCERA